MQTNKRDVLQVLLPRTFIPTKYTICLKPCFSSFTFDGEEEVIVDVGNISGDYSKIVCHSLDITIDEKSVKVLDIATNEPIAKVTSISSDTALQQVTFHLDQSIQNYKKFKLHLKFKGELNDKLCGFYRSSYKTIHGEKKYLATTQFEAVDARRAFPCWDEPALKCTFVISLVIPNELEGLSNMSPIKTSDVDNGYKRIDFEETPIMSTYLVAFIVGKFHFVERVAPKTKKRIRVYSPDNGDGGEKIKVQGEFALNVACHALDYFSEYFGIEFPISKLDLVAIPDFAAGAMENWGLITYRETSLLIDPENSSSLIKQRVARTVSHECFSKGTQVLMHDGQTKKIESIHVGEFVLGPDSKPRRVINTANGYDEMYRIVEKCEPKKCETIEYTCNSRHLLQITTPCNPSLITRNIGGRISYMVKYFALNFYEIQEKKRIIKMVSECEKLFSHLTDANDFKDGLTGKEINWTIRAQDYKYMEKSVKEISFQNLAPILLEKNILPTYLKQNGWDPSLANQISYLLGVWTGIGEASRPMLLTDKLDYDLQERIQNFAKLLNLNFQISNSDGDINHISLESIHPQKTRNNRNVFWEVIKTFCITEKNEKNIPHFLMTEELSTREWFLAGLIDSNKEFKKDESFVELVTKTESMMKEIVEVTKSLGIDTSAMCTDGSIDCCKRCNCKAYEIRLSQCSALQNILSKCSIKGKRMEAPPFVKYENQKFYFNVEKCQNDMEDYYGITLPGDTDQLFLLSNNVIVHNCAHSWFGNLVTMEWWDYLWLNEGFARFVEHFAVSNMFDWDIWTQFVENVLTVALSLDSLKNSHPVEVPVSDPGEINEIFDSISYAKGGSIIRMLADTIGEKNMQEGLRIYLKSHLYKNATSDNLWESLSKAVSNLDVKQLMDTWTKKVGYPVVIVQKEEYDTKKNNLTLHLKQTRFLIDGTTENDSLWQIPIRITASNQQNVLFIMKSKEQCVTLENTKENEFVKLNAGQTGFFRVQYTENMLQRLSEACATKKLQLAADRLALVSDCFALSKAGKLSVVSCLDLVLHGFSEEDNYSVWSEISSNLSSLNLILMKEEETIRNNLHSFIRKIFEPLLEKQFNNDIWNINITSDLVKLLRALVIARLLSSQHEKLISEAMLRFQQYIGGNKNSISADVRSSVFRAVVANGSEKEYSQVKTLYLNEQSTAEERRSCLTALCATKNGQLIKETVDFIFSDKVKSQDLSFALGSLSINPNASDAAWNYVKNHWDQIYTSYGHGNFMLRGIVTSCVSYFTKSEKAKELQQFLDAHSDKCSGAERSFLQCIEKINNKAQFLEREKDKMASYLEKFQS